VLLLLTSNTPSSLSSSRIHHRCCPVGSRSVNGAGKSVIPPKKWQSTPLLAAFCAISGQSLSFSQHRERLACVIACEQEKGRKRSWHFSAAVCYGTIARVVLHHQLWIQQKHGQEKSTNRTGLLSVRGRRLRYNSTQIVSLFPNWRNSDIWKEPIRSTRPHTSMESAQWSVIQKHETQSEGQWPVAVVLHAGDSDEKSCVCLSFS
jgi:hypothetical protein